MAVTQKKDGRWCVYYRVRGENGKSRVKWESFGRGASAEARAYARDAELGLQRRRPRQESAGVTFLELAREYLHHRGLNDNSRKQLSIRLEAHLAPAFGAMSALRIKTADVDAYVSARRAAGVSDATICRELTDLKAILNWSTRRDPPLIPHNPVANYPKPRPRHAVAQPPTRAEAMRIYQHALPHVRRAMLLSWHLGLRPQGELLALTWDAVRWETSRILIISAAKGGPAAREVPVHPDLMSALRRWHAQDKKQGRRHLVHYRGRRVKSIGRAWRKAVADAKIGRRVRPYDLRHYFITQALAEGADLKALSEVVGSAPQTIVKFYQHVLGRQHEQTIALVKPLAPGRKRHKKGTV